MLFSSQRASASRHGVATSETRAPIGYAVAALNKLAQSDLLDKTGLRKQTEHLVYTTTRGGFRTAAAAGRAFAKKKSSAPGVRSATATSSGLFDLTPTEDEQMLVDVVGQLAAEVVRPAASAADDACATPDDVLAAGIELGLPVLGVPEKLGGISDERTAVATTLVAEALAKGDMGIAVATLASGAVATAISLWGDDGQQQTYLPAFAGPTPPVAALALSEPTVLFDALSPSTVATRADSGYTLSGTKSAVVRGDECELFVVGALLDGRPALFLVPSDPTTIQVEADPSMGVRAAGMAKVTFDAASAELLGDTDAAAYTEAVRLSRIGWCALAVGTAQAVLDYVTVYVKEREAFGEPIAHRQSVAFMVADIAIELQAMRLLTWRAASRAAAGEEFAREAALARRACAEKGMKIGLDGVQLLGGHGFVKEHPVERWYRDLRAVGVMEGGVLV
ncbi:acyl-CoA dehydrogenase family protein [Nocardioides yefusunii]|uniref:Acyl-CoA dehydrogenase family protein n=1 Tax=Nocardioides yefusunii TaxID=2500546 RepID=A0ABW1QU21_9ACTN|nr:acyl-CoA dehydrogenase family protein [Nocardioides yefusunii]